MLRQGRAGATGGASDLIAIPCDQVPLMELTMHFNGPRQGPTLYLPEDASDPEAMMVVMTMKLNCHLEMGGEQHRQEITFDAKDVLV